MNLYKFKITVKNSMIYVVEIHAENSKKAWSKILDQENHNNEIELVQEVKK